MTHKPFQTLRDRYLTDPIEQARVAEISRAMGVVRTLAQLAEPACEAAPDDGSDSPSANRTLVGDEDSLFLATLREGTEALGGRLEVTAVFPDRRISLIRERVTMADLR